MIDQARITQDVHSVLTQTIDTTGSVHLVFRYHNPQNHRYYLILVGTDMFNDLVLIREWGSTKTNAAQSKQTVYSHREMPRLITKTIDIIKDRIRHGYHQVQLTAA